MERTDQPANFTPCGCCMSKASCSMNRRQFIIGAGAGLAAVNLAMSSLAQVSAGSDVPQYQPTAPKPLIVQPVLAIQLFQRHPQTSWRSWGGFHTQEDITKEQARISEELKKLQADSEFAMQVRPLVTLSDANKAAELAKADHDLKYITLDESLKLGGSLSTCQADMIHYTGMESCRAGLS